MLVEARYELASLILLILDVLCKDRLPLLLRFLLRLPLLLQVLEMEPLLLQLPRPCLAFFSLVFLHPLLFQSLVLHLDLLDLSLFLLGPAPSLFLLTLALELLLSFLLLLLLLSDGVVP